MQNNKTTNISQYLSDGRWIVVFSTVNATWQAHLASQAALITEAFARWQQRLIEEANETIAEEGARISEDEHQVDRWYDELRNRNIDLEAAADRDSDYWSSDS